jgi:hypothetical protein
MRRVEGAESAELQRESWRKEAEHGTIKIAGGEYQLVISRLKVLLRGCRGANKKRRPTVLMAYNLESEPCEAVLSFVGCGSHVFKLRQQTL